MTAILLACASVLAAVFGGWLALSEKKRLNLTLGFTAGALMGLVAFDLLPEIFGLSLADNLDTIWPMVALVVGFLAFHTIEKFILIHQSHEHEYIVHRHPQVGVASALALFGHSFLDGLSIGLAFQINNIVGTAVALAVIGHRFADGFNSVNLMLYHGSSRRRTLQLLAAVALAPILGVASSFLLTPPPSLLAIYLGFFAGFLIYISASDILPQAHSKGSSYKTVFFTVLGAAFIFLITRLV